MKESIEGTVVELREFAEGQVEVVVLSAEGEALMIARFSDEDLSIPEAVAKAAAAIVRNEGRRESAETLLALELSLKRYWPV